MYFWLAVLVSWWQSHCVIWYLFWVIHSEGKCWTGRLSNWSKMNLFKRFFCHVKVLSRPCTVEIPQPLLLRAENEVLYEVKSLTCPIYLMKYVFLELLKKKITWSISYLLLRKTLCFFVGWKTYSFKNYVSHRYVLE